MALSGSATGSTSFGPVFITPARPYRAIGPEASGGGSGSLVFFADVTESEEGHDELFITENPIETGAAISDHAYKRPPEVVLRVGFSNSSPAAGGDPTYASTIYNRLLQFQNDHWPFDLYTGKRVYQNMLMASISLRTDSASEYALLGLELRMRNIILVSTQSLAVNSNPANQSNPQATQPVQNSGSKNLIPASNLNQTVGIPPPGQNVPLPNAGVQMVPLDTPPSPSPNPAPSGF